MRVAAAHQETFRQRNQRMIVEQRLSGLRDDRIGKGGFQPNAGGACEYELFSRASTSAERVIGRVLYQQSAKVRFRTEITSCHPAVDCPVAATGRVQIIVAAVPDVAKARFAEAHRLRKDRD